MGRHVHEMARARSQRRQPFRAGERPLGAGRGLHRVDVIVAGAWMVGVDRQHLLECGHDVLGPALRLAIERPVIPGLQIHERFRVERAGGRIVRIPLP